MPSNRALTLLVALALWTAPALAQMRMVSGKITDSLQRPVPLAHVFLVDSRGERLGQIGAITDANGWYTLRLTLADTGRLVVRRIGYLAEAPRVIPWGDRSVLQMDWSVRAVAQTLRPVRVLASGCHALQSYDDQHAVRQLWDGAVSTVAARVAFLDSYEYREHWTRRETRAGAQTRVTHDSVAYMKPPVADIEPDFREKPLGVYGPPGRTREVSAWAPVDRALLDSVFIARFCFEDVVTWVGDTLAQVKLREVGRLKGEVTATGTIGFRVDAPGLANVTFQYLVDGKELGTATVLFTHFPVEGATFPLESSASIQLRDPLSGRALSSATSTRTYSEFKRVTQDELISAALFR